LDDDTGDGAAVFMNPAAVVEVRLPDNMDVEVCTIQVLFEDCTLSHFRLLNMELGAGQVVPILMLAERMLYAEFDPPEQHLLPTHALF
jgi:hypothetical protein